MIHICIFFFSWCSMIFFLYISLSFFLYQWFKYNISLLFEEIVMLTKILEADMRGFCSTHLGVVGETPGWN
jgi:hypothetical protein